MKSTLPAPIRQRCAGFSLLEVVLALALVAIAISLMAQLVSIGNRAAAGARDASKAQMIAESVMDEVLAGVLPLQSTSAQWEIDPNWTYDVDVSSGPSDNINVIRVSVSQNSESSRAVSFNLTQWLSIPPEEAEDVADSTTSL